MTVLEMEMILCDVSVPEYKFDIVDTSNGLCLRGSYQEADISTGDTTDQFTRCWPVSEHFVKSELVQTVFKCYVTSMEHRAREHFLYRGKRVFGPHFDVDALWEICDKKHLDYRGKE
jgi:hypothetical protein